MSCTRRDASSTNTTEQHKMLVASAIAPAELPSRIAEVSLLRAAGVSHPPDTYESLMLACVEHGRPTYAYRLLEEGAADGPPQQGGGAPPAPQGPNGDTGAHGGAELPATAH